MAAAALKFLAGVPPTPLPPSSQNPLSFSPHPVDVAAKKKKAGGGANGAAPTQQTTPPSVPVKQLFPAGVFPEGEWQSYQEE